MTIAVLDFSQTVIAAVSVISKDLKGGDAPDLIRHCALNQILKLKKKFGNLVIAVDSRQGYWRKDNFPAYKGHRKHAKAKDDFLDWDLIGRVMDEFKQELIDNFQYKVIEVSKAEADDILAVLSKYHLTNELETMGLFEEPQEIILVSTDGDSNQLLKYPHVKQWHIIKDSFVSVADPKMSLVEKVCKGDAGDNVPGILTSDQWAEDRANNIKPTRQKPFKSTRLENFYVKGIDACLDDTEKKHYLRNQMLVDLDNIPSEIEQNIIDTYKNYTVKGSKMKILTYLGKHRMKQLMDSANQF